MVPSLELRLEPDQELVLQESHAAHLPDLRFLEVKKEEEGDSWWMTMPGSEEPLGTRDQLHSHKVLVNSSHRDQLQDHLLDLDPTRSHLVTDLDPSPTEDLTEDLDLSVLQDQLILDLTEVSDPTEVSDLTEVSDPTEMRDPMVYQVMRDQGKVEEDQLEIIMEGESDQIILVLMQGLDPMRHQDLIMP